MSLEDFYASLAQFSEAESGEDWFEGDVIDALVVMPSKGLTLEEILSSSDERSGWQTHGTCTEVDSP